MLTNSEDSASLLQTFSKFSIFSCTMNFHCVIRRSLHHSWLVEWLQCYDVRFAALPPSQAISDLGVDAMSHASATPKSRAPSARVTSGVRRLPNVTYPTVSATPGGTGPTQPSVLLLSNTGGIFETLESHQVSCWYRWIVKSSCLVCRLILVSFSIGWLEKVHPSEIIW